MTNIPAKQEMDEVVMSSYYKDISGGMYVYEGSFQPTEKGVWEFREAVAEQLLHRVSESDWSSNPILISIPGGKP